MLCVVNLLLLGNTACDEDDFGSQLSYFVFSFSEFAAKRCFDLVEFFEWSRHKFRVVSYSGIKLDTSQWTKLLRSPPQ